MKYVIAASKVNELYKNFEINEIGNSEVKDITIVKTFEQYKLENGNIAFQYIVADAEGEYMAISVIYEKGINNLDFIHDGYIADLFPNVDMTCDDQYEKFINKINLQILNFAIDFA